MSDIPDAYLRAKGPHKEEAPKKAAKVPGVCMHCGGEVDSHGYALGGEVEELEDETPPPKKMDETERSALFAKALKDKRL